MGEWVMECERPWRLGACEGLVWVPAAVEDWSMGCERLCWFGGSKCWVRSAAAAECAHACMGVGWSAVAVE